MFEAAVARARRDLSRGQRRRANVQLVVDADHYDSIIDRELRQARVSVWIATANLKELRVEAPVGTRARARGRHISVLEVLEGLVSRDVEVRILHGRAPSRPFAQQLQRRRGLQPRLGMRECPRVHLKVVAVDGQALYLGSANFTGAGLGARSERRRNFELGLLTDDEHLLDVVQARFDQIWSGAECASCGLRRQCPRPIDTLDTSRPKSRAKILRPPR